VCVCVCVCVSERAFHFVTRRSMIKKERKKNLELSKNTIKQFPHILTYRRSSSEDNEDRYLCP